MMSLLGPLGGLIAWVPVFLWQRRLKTDAAGRAPGAQSMMARQWIIRSTLYTAFVAISLVALSLAVTPNTGGVAQRLAAMAVLGIAAGVSCAIGTLLCTYLVAYQAGWLDGRA